MHTHQVMWERDETLHPKISVVLLLVCAYTHSNMRIGAHHQMQYDAQPFSCSSLRAEIVVVGPRTVFAEGSG